MSSVTLTVSCDFSGSLFPWLSGQDTGPDYLPRFFISERSDQGWVDMGWAPWGWQRTTSTAPQHHEGCFSAFQKETDCEGRCGKLCSKLKLKEEQERQEKDTPLPFGQTVHQQLLHQEYNKKHTSASGSRMLQEHPVVFQGVTSPIQAACTCAIQAEHILSPLLESLMMLTSILFCYSDYSGHRLQTDSHWVSFVWSLQHFKKFSTCCQQHLKFEQFYVEIQVGNFSCKVRSTTSALILTRWLLAGTESQLCPVEGIRGSWLNHKDPLPAPRGLPHSQYHSFMASAWVLKGWCLSPQLEEVFRYADTKGTEKGISPPTWEQGPVQSCSPPPASWSRLTLPACPLTCGYAFLSWCFLG